MKHITVENYVWDAGTPRAVEGVRIISQGKDTRFIFVPDHELLAVATALADALEAKRDKHVRRDTGINAAFADLADR